MDFLKWMMMTYNPKSRQIRVNTLLNGQIVIFMLDESNVEEEGRVVRTKEIKEVKKGIKLILK